MLKGIENYLDKIRSIKVKHPNTLFDVEPSWEKLKEGRCPICGSRLRAPKGKSISICYGKRHGDKQKFVIKNETLVKLV